MKKLCLFCLLTIILSLTPLVALASDVSDADYYGTITVTNNSTANINVPTTFTANTTAMIAQGFLNATANNCAIQTSSGADVPFMPGYTPGGYPWSIFVASIAGFTQVNDLLYTGNVSGGQLSIFPDSGGMTIDDAATMEPSDNFSLEFTDIFLDTSQTNTVIMQKSGAYLFSTGNAEQLIFSSGTANTSYIVNDDTINNLYGQYRSGQTFTTTGDWLITSVRVKILRVGNPGTMTAAIYATAAGLPTGSALTTGTINGDTFTTAAGGKWENIDITDYQLTSGQVYALVIYGGIDAANMARWRDDETAPTYANGNRVYSTDTGASWTADAGDDFMFAVYYSALSVIANGVTTSEKSSVRVWSDSANIHISIDGVESDNASTSAIPDNSNQILITGNVTPYIGGFSFTKGGIERALIRWNYGTTFTDLSGNGNDATPTFRTADASPYISAELVGFAPVTEAKAPAYVLSTAPDFWTTAPSVTGNFTTNTSGALYPGHGVITAIAIGGSTPEQFLTYILAAFIIILIIGLPTAYFLAKYGRGDTTLVLASVIFTAMCLGVAVRVIDVWQVYFFVIMAWGIRELEKDARGT